MVDYHGQTWGPDVSSWQGNVDWQAVKNDGASFGITKVTEGVDYVNPFATGAWQGMKDAGLVRVQYHYARPAILSPFDEASFFLNNALPLEHGDIIALDLERDARDGGFSDGAQWSDTWLQRVTNAVGFNPMLYCNSGIIRDGNQDFLSHPDMGTKWGLWLAAWIDALPNAPAPWDTVALWQFTSTGHVPGIGGPVDLNIFNGDVETMKRYGLQDGGGEDTGGNPDSGLRERVDDLFVKIRAVNGQLTSMLEEAVRIMDSWPNG